ncbi:putative ORF3 protein [Giant panda associated gemycircularvirus]|uniref:Putative ORF3 protein n=1 Tax=Giant panda associated gemycircularvirus TaxID=2016461 RepID=A0A220IGM3_9VIRU|nr:putative ORF3 protein [Giant panda associated gemycircularvirus]ASH99141.1 putative ORF3 protein [Giant panda associated gemycircularvirus]
MSSASSLAMEELSLSLCNGILRILCAYELDESLTAMEAFISMYSLALSRLSLSSHPTLSITSDLTGILNRFEQHHERYTTMSERTTTSFTSMVQPPMRLVMMRDQILRDGTISSAATLRNLFCQRSVHKLLAIGCFRSTGSLPMPSTPTPPSYHHINHRSSLRRMDAFRDLRNGESRQPLAELSENGKALSPPGGRPECRRLTPLRRRFLIGLRLRQVVVFLLTCMQS